MNIYDKLQALRLAILETKIRRSGRNEYSKYDYFELEDFIPPTMQHMKNLSLTSVTAFDADIATLTIYNIEKPEEFLQFTSPMAGVALKGMHDIQNLGAAHTYLRRYLWILALELVEHDAISSSKPEATKTTKQNTPTETPVAVTSGDADSLSTTESEPLVATINPEQQKKLIETSKKNGWTSAMAKKFLNGQGFESSNFVTTDKYEDILDALKDRELWAVYAGEAGK